MQRVSCVCSKCLTCAKCKMQNAVLLFSPRIFARRRTGERFVDFHIVFLGFLLWRRTDRRKGAKLRGGEKSRVSKTHPRPTRQHQQSTQHTKQQKQQINTGTWCIYHSSIITIYFELLRVESTYCTPPSHTGHLTSTVKR